MRATITFIALFLSVINLNAQVVLTKANVPTPGTIFINYDANVPAIPFVFEKSGSGNTWDFTGIPFASGQDDTISYLLPFAVDIPASDYAVTESGEKTYTFIKLQDNGVYVTGLFGDLVGSGKNIAFPFSSPLLIKPFPFNASTQYQGSASLDTKKTGLELGYPLDSAWINIKSSTKLKVIASGNIVLPSGTFPALLEMSENVTIDTVRVKISAGTSWMVIKTSIETDTTYKWYTQESIEPYAQAIYKKGELTDVKYHKSNIPLGLNDGVNTSTTSIRSYPNPTKDILNFSIENELVEIIKVISSDGKEMDFSSSVNSINISSLQSGIYIAKIQLKNGQVKLSTFVKN